MKLIELEHLWQPGGWVSPAFVRIDDRGAIQLATQKPQDLPSERVRGYALPGMPNLHSHAFQRAMAGLAEHGTSPDESFWTWREIMYALAQRIEPDDVEAIAAQLYVEMLKAGYTAVGEFHYLHRDRDGSLYAEPAELSLRIARAAERTGIGLTLLGVLYRSGGFGGALPAPEQRRFVLGVDELLSILDRVRELHPEVRVGIAPHSLRAVSSEDLVALLAGLSDRTAPVHLHIAEQIKEVRDCVAWSGVTPVAWLLDRVEVDERWCLIHSTHVSAEELTAIARSGAIVGLCPTTEANLGDGIFPAPRFLELGGRFGIGSDSHVTVSPTEELRWLEYAQRLKHEQRNLVGDGAKLWHAAQRGGTQALGRGARADLIVLDPDHSSLIERPLERVLDAFVFGGGSSAVRDVMAGGRWVVREGRHFAEDEVREAYRRALRRLG